MALSVLGCAKPDKGHPTDTHQAGTDVNYTVLLRKDAVLKQAYFSADATLIQSVNPIGETAMLTYPKLSYREGNSISLYAAQPDCTGEVVRFNFNTDQKVVIPVFEDIASCAIDVLSITHSADAVYLAYSYPGSGLKEKHYFIRAVPVADGSKAYWEYELSRESIQIVYSNSKIFVLSRDEDKGDKDGADEFTLLVLNPADGVLLHEINLDEDAQKIFRTNEGHVLVTYPKLHLLIDSQTLGILKTVRYNTGTGPNFGSVDKAFFDLVGNLYYPMPTGLSGTTYKTIPGVYDFSNNTSIVYYYENFLTGAERKFEYEIGDTSLVAYDAANNLILIGYQKLGENGLGGLLRIRPTPGLELVDNIDLDGIPYELFIPGQ